MTTSTVGAINAWEQDPGSLDKPDGGLLLPRPLPDMEKPPFATQITGSKPPADHYAPGTAAFRYWACADALRRAADFWGGQLGATQKWNHAIKGNILPVILDEGVDLNAYYDRKALNFFHAAVAGRMVYSGESPDIVCHEFGHGILDAICPKLWDTAAFEPPAFHESFADCSAILTALQLPSVRSGVLQETGGTLYRSSRLSRLAEQLGWAIRQKYPDAVDPDCLRNAVNSFFYKDPDSLPTSGPAGELSSEPHSLSRVFTSAFFQSLGLMFASAPAQNEDTLRTVAEDLTKIFIRAVKASPVVPEYFSQVGGHMAKIAAAKSKSYGDAVKTAMLKHGILSVPGIATIASAPEGEIPEAASAPAVASIAGPQEVPADLELDVSSYGLTVKKVYVVPAGEKKRFGIAGAAASVGDAPSISSDRAALGFFEDLIRRGRLELGAYASFATPGLPQKTHHLKQETDRVVLRRIRIDCGLRGYVTKP